MTVSILLCCRVLSLGAFECVSHACREHVCAIRLRRVGTNDHSVALDEMSWAYIGWLLRGLRRDSVCVDHLRYERATLSLSRLKRAPRVFWNDLAACIDCEVSGAVRDCLIGASGIYLLVSNPGLVVLDLYCEECAAWPREYGYALFSAATSLGTLIQMHSTEVVIRRRERRPEDAFAIEVRSACEVDDLMIFEWFQSHQKLGSVLDLRLNGALRDAGLVAFITPLASGAMASIEKLALDCSKMGNAGLIALSGALLAGKMKTLRCLDLEDNEIGDAGLKSLAGALSIEATPNLEVIRRPETRQPKRPPHTPHETQKTHIQNPHMRTSVARTHPKRRTQSINLAGNRFGDAGLVALSNAFSNLRSRPFVKVLDLNSHNFGVEGLKSLSRALCSTALTGSLLYLDISSSGLGDAGVVALSEHLTSGALNSLETLRLGSNRIGDTGINYLARAFFNGGCTKLKELYLKGNRIGDDGLDLLSGALSKMEDLKKLYLGDNQIGDRGVKSLAVALCEMKKLQVLYLSRNQIGDEGLRSLALALPSEYLTELYLSSNHIGNDGIKSLSTTLSDRPMQKLVRLDLDDNDIGDEGIKSLCRALSERPSNYLKELLVRNNMISDAGIKSLVDAATCITYPNIL